MSEQVRSVPQRLRGSVRVPATEVGGDVQASAPIFLILRRMRAPLIILILVLAVSVLGLTLVPGQDDEGRPWRMGIFDAFYFMSYTATTIGFGELPYPFTDAQRLWVTVSIYLTVIAWAYAIGALLTLLQDRTFQQALALQHFARKVARLREPFLLLAGYGQTGEMLARSFDELGRRIVVLDRSGDRIDALDLASYHSDVPGLAADARDPHSLTVAGLAHPCCEGVLALTDDDEANLAVAMAAALLRPDLTVVAGTTSPAVAHRMRAFGTPTVINPFDRFGEHLLLAMRSPASYQLMTWLEGGPGAELPERGSPPTSGRWIVCGYGRFGRALTADLQAAGLEVTVIDPNALAEDNVDVVPGDGSEPGVLARAGLESAVGFVAGTDNDTTNLSLVAAVRQVAPELFLIGRQNRPANAPLFRAMGLDALLVPTELVAHEAYAHLSTPLLWQFLQEMPLRGDAWAADVVDRLTGACGRQLESLWKVRLTREEAPAPHSRLAEGNVPLGDLLRNPEDRDELLPAVVLLVLRSRPGKESRLLMPGPDVRLASGDQLLLAGHPSARRALENTLVVQAMCDYVLTGDRRPVGWLWRRLASRPSAWTR